MNFEKNDSLEITEDILKEIVRVSREVFGRCILIPCDHHISGYDFINLDAIELEPLDGEEEYSVLKYKFEGSDITDGIYDSHPYEGLTLEEVLCKTKKRFRFE